MLARLTSLSAAGHTKGILGLSTAIASNGATVVSSVGYDGCLKLWELEGAGELRLLHELKGFSAGPIFSIDMCANADGTMMLCAGTYCRRLCVFDYAAAAGASPQMRWSSQQHTGWVRALAIGKESHGGKYAPAHIYSIGCNRILDWSTLDGASEASIRSSDVEIALFEDSSQVRSHDVLCLAHGDAEGVLACGSVDGALRAWDTTKLRGGLHTLTASTPHHWIGHNDRGVLS